jgi:hypothetical protein
METVVITLPLPARVLSPNCPVGSIGGRYMKASASKRYRRLAKDAVEDECITTGPWRHATVEVTFHHKQQRRRDQDNAMASLKAVYDGIVDSGLIVDDDYDHLERRSPRFLIDREYPRVTLIIERDE